jgi:hypothetical protein
LAAEDRADIQDLGIEMCSVTQEWFREYDDVETPYSAGWN